MSVMAELCLFPMGEGDSVDEYVARAVKVIKESGLGYAMGPMGTTIEGEWDEVMACVTKCYKVMEADCDRVYMILKVDARKGRDDGLSSKMKTLQNHL